MKPAITDLYSPGAQTSTRAAVELRMNTVTMRSLGQFLSGVRHDALSATSAFTAGEVAGLWDDVVWAMVGVTADVMGLPRPTPGTPVADDHLRFMVQRLRASDVPGEAYTSARAVLADGGGRAALRDALSLDSGETVLTAALSVVGVSWRVLGKMHARTEATAACGQATLVALASLGVKRKQWVHHHDAITRPTHRAVDGESIPLNRLFRVGDQVMQYPGDPRASSAEVANCRCSLVGYKR